jgi:uncharacterized protein (TIGR02421 family)
LLAKVQRASRILPALTAGGEAAERARLVRALERGETLRLEQVSRRRVRILPALEALDHARELARDAPVAKLYAARIEELELELSLLASLGDASSVRPIAARLYGKGDLLVPLGAAQRPVRDVAKRLLADVADEKEAEPLPAEAERGESVAGLMREAARHARFEIEVKVDARLVSDAAAGERTVYLAQRRFGRRRAARLAIHEVLGHLLAGANGRAQPLGLLALGTAGSFADQEGVAIHLEEEADLLDGHRVRTLAARVLATDSLHEGASLHETARMLYRDHGFAAGDAVVMALRAHRGGGVARDAVYLSGWLRVRHAIEQGLATSMELRNGKLALGDLPLLRELTAEGLWRPPAFRSRAGYCPSSPELPAPKRSSSLRATASGTSPETSPPSRLASLTRFDAT